MTSQGSAVSAIAPDDLTAVARTRVFFGHQSVGMDVLGGVAASTRSTVCPRQGSSRMLARLARTAGSSATPSLARTETPC